MLTAFFVHAMLDRDKRAGIKKRAPKVLDSERCRRWSSVSFNTCQQSSPLHTAHKPSYVSTRHRLRSSNDDVLLPAFQPFVR